MQFGKLVVQRWVVSTISTAALLTWTCVAGLAQSPYKVIEHWKIGGTGGWDYVQTDPSTHLLYVTHGPQVEVLSTETGKKVGVITGLKGTHGVVLDPSGDVGYVSDGQGNDVAVFDRKSFAVLATVPAGTNPDGMTWEPTTKSVWAFNGRSNDVTVIDSRSRSVLGTTKLPGKPEFPQADGRGNVFANIEDKNSIVKLSASSRQVLDVIQLQGCDSPSGMAIDMEHQRIFSVCDGGKMAVVDTSTDKQIATASIGDGPDAAGFSAAKQLAFSSNGDGTLSVVDAAHGYKTVQSVSTQRGARTMSYDESKDRVYLVTATLGPRPAPTAAQPRPRPSIVPDSFEVIVVGR